MGSVSQEIPQQNTRPWQADAKRPYIRLTKDALQEILVIAEGVLFYPTDFIFSNATDETSISRRQYMIYVLRQAGYTWTSIRAHTSYNGTAPLVSAYRCAERRIAQDQGTLKRDLAQIVWRIRAPSFATGFLPACAERTKRKKRERTPRSGKELSAQVFNARLAIAAKILGCKAEYLLCRTIGAQAKKRRMLVYVLYEEGFSAESIRLRVGYQNVDSIYQAHKAVKQLLHTKMPGRKALVAAVKRVQDAVSTCNSET